MAITEDSIIKWIFGTGSTVGIATLLWRFIVSTNNINTRDKITIEADVKAFNRMQAEISELKSTIKQLVTDIKELKAQINVLRTLEISAASDFGALETIIHYMPCHLCTAPGESIDQLKTIVGRMRERRETRNGIFSNVEQMPDYNSLDEEEVEIGSSN